MNGFLMAGGRLVPVSDVRSVDYTALEQGIVDIHTHNNASFRAEGFDAIEAIYILKPGALEGKRLKWQRNAWAWHNFVIHPVMQILVWFGFKKQAIRLHDRSVPEPIGLRD